MKKLLIILLSAITSLTAIAQPKATFPERSKDAGTHNDSETITVEYPIRNDGKGSLFIYFVRPSCSCMVTTYDSVIAPGKTGKIKVEINLAGQSGQVGRGMIVKTNDPVKATVELYLQYTVVAKTSSSATPHHHGQAEEDWAIQRHPSFALAEDAAW